MAQTLEQMLSSGSNIFEQPIFTTVFERMTQIIGDTSKNPSIKFPESLVLYKILLSSLDGLVAFRNRVSEFKKISGIPLSAPIAKKLSMYLHLEVFGQNPLLRDYLEHYRDLKDGIVADGSVMAYPSFTSQYSQN